MKDLICPSCGVLMHYSATKNMRWVYKCSSCCLSGPAFDSEKMARAAAEKIFYPYMGQVSTAPKYFISNDGEIFGVDDIEEASLIADRDARDNPGVPVDILMSVRRYYMPEPKGIEVEVITIKPAGD